MGVVPNDEEARALTKANVGKIGRPFKHSDLEIAHLKSLRACTNMKLRRTEGFLRRSYGKGNTCRTTRPCASGPAHGRQHSVRHGCALQLWPTPTMTTDRTGQGQTGTNGWRHEKHGGKPGHLLYHAVANKKTGKFVASKTTATGDGDAPQFEELVEVSLRKYGMDPKKRREEVRRRRADPAAEKAVVVSCNDKIADASPRAVAKVAASVEGIHGSRDEKGEWQGRRLQNGQGCGPPRAGHGGGNRSSPRRRRSQKNRYAVGNGASLCGRHGGVDRHHTRNHACMSCLSPLPPRVAPTDSRQGTQETAVKVVGN